MTTKDIDRRFFLERFFLDFIPDDISKEDVNKAEKALLEGKYDRSTWIDIMCVSIVNKYLSHFSGNVFNIKEILNETTVRSIIEKDERLRLIKEPEILIPESFYKTCNFIEMNNFK